MSLRFNIVCVLRSGGEYLPEHVQTLAAQVNQYVTVPHRFVCLTDIDVPGVECVKMLRNWPGWWSKIELFEVFRQAFYLDLDTRIIGNIDHLVAFPHVFTMLRDFGRPTSPASGLMAWDGNFASLALRFAHNPIEEMAKCQKWDCWGDQGFIAKHINPAHFQDHFDGEVVSYKIHCKNGVPDGAKIVCFHGKPRPWDSMVALQHG